MCVAMPGKVIEVTNDGKAKIDFEGNVVEAYCGLVNLKPGDYALVHAGCVIQKMLKSEIDEMAEIMSLMDESMEADEKRLRDRNES